jgi:hypothetical protein
MNCSQQERLRLLLRFMNTHSLVSQARGLAITLDDYASTIEDEAVAGQGAGAAAYMKAILDVLMSLTTNLGKQALCDLPSIECAVLVVI